MLSDPISDMLIRIKNAQAVKRKGVEVPFSNIKFRIAEILSKKGFVGQVKRISKKKGKKSHEFILIALRYEKDGSPAISDLKRISKPGRRIYLKAGEIKKVKGGRGVLIISTPKGLMTGFQAKRENVGGEAIAEIW